MTEPTMSAPGDDAAPQAAPDQPTSGPPGGGRWTWAHGAWVELPEPVDAPNEPQE